MEAIKRHTKRALVTLLGLVIILAGIVMLVTPGPGLLTIIIGLTVLATEYVWAHHLLQKAKDHYEAGKQKALNRLKSKSDKKTSHKNTDQSNSK
ncbi:MAG: PGPGW domain-containing protein [bacterium]